MDFNIKKICVGAVGTNCFIVYKGSKCFVLDPGGGFEKIKKVIEENNLNLSMIINTHGHYDHIWANKELAEYFDIPIWIHSNDKEMLTDPEKNASIFSAKKITSPKAKNTLSNGDKFKFGDSCWEILHTPGHTKGSICIKNKSEKILFTGDTLFKQGWGRTDLPGGNNEQMKKSLLKLINLKDNYKCYPGHGPDFMLNNRKEELKTMLNNFSI
ncbi:MAG: MBL fold metallo-hydrolase [Candidatus Mcinerneyibacterium aminivorans]|uniref:MBL fold metallo-hydrolase n=1 Tax=Candidatus Mcinerneyibacterium aminivorans TaxID=2703815 RepID=A0A5D0MGP7_9BACT|nr:MAG: MBL fold metallo-hydrolase [Candidatus Mcinerneyibacterium aminivorans]